MKFNGRVKAVTNHGYGFIVSDAVDFDIFFHLHDWRSAEMPLPGQSVTFELIPARIPGRRDQATNVRPIGAGSGMPIPSAGLAVLAQGVVE